MAAINTDFITPLYDGDQTRYIYTGAAGKLLPCFYIYGREVHVGDTLAGIDPNFISSEITSRLHNNIHLAEKVEGELVLPHPVCISVITRNPIMCKRLSAPACISIVLFMKEQQKK